MRTNYPIVMNFVLVLLTASLAFAEVKEYTIAPAEENLLELDVDKTGLWKGKRHIFTFARYNGKLLYDPQNPAAEELVERRKFHPGLLLQLVAQRGRVRVVLAVGQRER